MLSADAVAFGQLSPAGFNTAWNQGSDYKAWNCFLCALGPVVEVLGAGSAKPLGEVPAGSYQKGLQLLNLL